MTDEQYFLQNTARRYRLRPAEPREAQRIGVEVALAIACKGGRCCIFVTERVPGDTDAALSRFLSDIQFFRDLDRPRNAPETPSHRVVTA
jgi:hypothetical protein